MKALQMINMLYLQTIQMTISYPCVLKICFPCFLIMTGPNCGCLPNSVSETIRDVWRILIEVGANDDLKVAFDKNLFSVEMKYIHQYCGGFKTYKIAKAGSIKKYLLSLQRFWQFLLSKDEEHNVGIQQRQISN